MVIIYDLVCDNEHKFEGWFKDRASFEDQKRRKCIECPVCGSVLVEMVPSSISISGRKASAERDREDDRNVSVPTMLKMLNDFIDKHFDDVGDRFADVAIKMHRGEETKRNIKGVTTKEEQETLEEEGIEFLRIPPPPKLDS